MALFARPCQACVDVAPWCGFHLRASGGGRMLAFGLSHAVCTLVLKYFHLPHKLCSSIVLPGRLQHPRPTGEGSPAQASGHTDPAGQGRAGQGRIRIGTRGSPNNALCVTPGCASERVDPHLPQLVVNSLVGTNLSTVDTGLSKASVPTSLLGLLSLLSSLQFPKPGAHGPVPWLGLRDATYRYQCQASTLA